MGINPSNIDRCDVGTLPGSRIAPTGRVIRSAGRPIIPRAIPANSDVLCVSRQHSGKLRLIKIAVLGVSCGAFISLMSPPLKALVEPSSTQRMFSAVRDNFLKAELAIDRQASPSPRQLRVSQAVQRLNASAERDVRAVNANATQDRVQAVRLASYSVAVPRRAPIPSVVPVSSKIQAQSATSLHKGVFTGVNAAPAPPVQREAVPAHASRALVGRVHSIITKYSPRHKSASQLAHAIVRESARQGVDPIFVAAVIKSESTFNESARSNKGAQGLMQIMPATGAWLTTKQDLPRGKLTDPGHNLRLGIAYLKYLEQTYEGNRVFTLVAYNWGPGHVESASGGKRRIPKECMTYALKIMNDYKRWSSGVI